jgi:hypothetical protein
MKKLCLLIVLIMTTAWALALEQANDTIYNPTVNWKSPRKYTIHVLNTRNINEVQVAIRTVFLDGLVNQLSKVITVAGDDSFSLQVHIAP